MKFKLLLPVLLLLSACAVKEETYEVQIAPESIPQYNIMTGPAGLKYNLLAPGNMYVVGDSMLVVYEAMVPVSIFKVFNINDGELISSFGKRGDGPDEFSQWPLLLTYDIYNDKKQFAVRDKNRITTFVFSPDSTTFFSRTDKETMPEELRLCNEVLADNDSVIITNCSAEGQLTIYNKPQQAVRYIDSFPDFVEGDIHPLCKNTQLYPATYLSNGEYIAIAYWMWNLIDIVDMQGRPVRRLLFPDYLSNKSKASYDGMNVTFTPDAKIFFRGGVAARDCFYVINYDCTRQESIDGEHISTIYQIDWSGKPIARYNVDRVFRTFCLAGDRIKYINCMGDDDEMHIMSADY